MSCAVGINTGKEIFIGVDSCASTDDQYEVRQDEKIFKKGPFIIAFVGSFRMAQILRYSVKFPKQIIKDDFQYLCTIFIARIRESLHKHGCLIVDQEDKTEAMDGSLLVAYKKKLYCIDDDFQVGVVNSEYNSIGSGAPYALGSLYTTEKLKLDPEERITLALESASKFSTSVTPPFKILSIKGRSKYKL